MNRENAPSLSIPTGSKSENLTRTTIPERVLFSALARMHRGELIIRYGDQEHRFGPGGVDALRAEIHVHDRSLFSRLLTGGTIGAAESYRDGEWETPDLTSVVRIFLQNRAMLDGVDGGVTRLMAPIRKLLHLWNRNSITGSRRNIGAHYDLSNEFFRLLLDNAMSYSSGIFESADQSLEEASIAKNDRLCRKLDLGPHDHLLEIGTGWGAFAIQAASEYGCRVTTTTISREQFLVARDRIGAAKLGDRIDLRLEDYRELSGVYDKLVSVEMIEAVGHSYYGEFFSSCSDRLAKDGLMAMQAITVADQHYNKARRTVDFIKKHIFPGCNIPSVTALLVAATRNSDLRVLQLEDITSHYPRTLREWRANLSEHREEARALGFDERFLRLWDFYLSYCEGGFIERSIGTVQMLFQKPEWRGEAQLS